MRCLIVDDAAIVRKVARRILERHRHMVSEADTGAQAIERIGMAEFDVMLLDWQLSDMTGIEVLKRLKQMPDVFRPVVIYCATEADPEDLVRAAVVGAHHLLMKPFDTISLTDKLNEIRSAA